MRDYRTLVMDLARSGGSYSNLSSARRAGRAGGETTKHGGGDENTSLTAKQSLSVSMTSSPKI